MYAPFFQSPPLLSRFAAAGLLFPMSTAPGPYSSRRGTEPSALCPGPHILDQASLPFSEGSTSSKDRMAHSIMLSSGSLVVKFCIHMPGAVRIFARALSWV